MSSAAVGTHSGGAGPLSLMSCVRESSPLQDYELDGEKNVATKRKFWNVKKWFKRKHKDVDHVVAVDTTSIERDVSRSRSTSELSITEEQTRRRSGSSMHPGLSVSHDSVFHSPNSGSDIELDQAQSTSSLSTSQPHIDSRLQNELSERLRLRRGRGDTSEDDEGLPRSPCNSPTTTETLLDKTAIKDLPTKSHSTCSDGSLLSMGSSEMDEESLEKSSKNSSKLSLHEKKSMDQIDSDLELGSTVAPLNHSAAHHRVSVRPDKRRAPHRKRAPQLSTNLPVTPEVNEDTSIRSVTPETSSRGAIVTETYSSMMHMSSTIETQLKCSSLPPGLAAPTTSSSSSVSVDNKLNRSQSNASKFHEEDEDREEKTDKSFFDRIFPRRSGKKRKSNNNNKEENCKMVKEVGAVMSATVDAKKVENRPVTMPVAAPRSGAASRQRIVPIDLPASPESAKRDMIQPKSMAMGSSPIHQELENRFKHMSSPPLSTVITTTSNKKEEIRSKMKIPGLSSLQQKVLTLNDEDDSEIDGGFKSLGEFLPPKKVSVAKSHSFKAANKQNFDENLDKTKEPLGIKASSLDSVKHLDESTTTTKTFLETEKEEITHESSMVIKESKVEVNESQDKDDELMIVKEFIPLLPESFSEVITISGPSHTAIFNVSDNFSSSTTSTKTKSEVTKPSKTDQVCKEVTTKETVSVTNIQLKRESTQVSQSTISVPMMTSNTATVPEFFNRQLNKVEARSSSNVVFSMNSPRIIDEQNKPKLRKFSQEDLEIVEKSPEEESKPLVTVTTLSPLRFKKNEVVTTKPRKTSIPESPTNSNRSSSLDSLLKVEQSESDKSSQDSLDKLEDGRKVTQVQESVVLRKRSQIKQSKGDGDEPELMKVFARRSLKLKDTESESIAQQITSMMNESSDKENQIDSPKEERRKSVINNNNNNKVKEEPAKEPLVESKPPEVVKAVPKVFIKENTTIASEQKFVETTEVTLRKFSPNNNVFPYQRKTIETINPVSNDLTKIKKQPSFHDRKKSDWISPNNLKESTDDGDNLKISQDEIIAVIAPKSEFITEPKNFNQRKAEWEKRAQEAQKKSVP